MKLIFKRLGLITIGAAIYALAINYFLLPNQIGEGGVTGLTAIGYYMFKIAPAWTNLVLNGILLLVGFRYLNKPTVGYSLWAVTWISLFLKLPVLMNYQTSQTIVPAIIGGVLMGISMGIIFRAGGTIAGSTIVAKIINKYLGIKNGTATLMLDLMVAIPSGFVIGFENMLLTVLELYVSAVILNQYLDRFGSKQSVLVISKASSQIAQELSQQIGQGVTLLNGTGFYEQTEQPIIYYVFNNQDLPAVIKIIESVDDQALVVLDQIRSVRGIQVNQLL